MYTATIILWSSWSMFEQFDSLLEFNIDSNILKLPFYLHVWVYIVYILVF